VQVPTRRDQWRVGALGGSHTQLEGRFSLSLGHWRMPLARVRPSSVSTQDRRGPFAKSANRQLVFGRNVLA
jgi:hypothetical protein